MTNLCLSETTHDLVVEYGNLKIATSIEAIAQKVKSRLLLFQGEWFLDKEDGVPYFTKILVKGPNFNEVDAIIRTRILDTEGVDSIVEYESNFNSTTREFDITFVIEANSEISEVQEVTL